MRRGTVYLRPRAGVAATLEGYTIKTIEALITAAAFSDERAQDATGSMAGSSLVYVDATPLFARAALTGDVTASQDSNTTTIANDAVTYAKIQNVSAISRLLGRGAGAGAGDPEEITLGTNLSMSGTTLNTAGEANTASNVGLGEEVFKQKTGVNFEFNSLRSTGSVDIQPGLGEILFEVNPLVIDISDFLNAGTLATQSGTFSGTSSGTNTGDQTSIVGITGTIAQFNTACTDADFMVSPMTTAGDIIYGGASGVATRLADVATGNSLISGGVGVAPAWGKVGMTTHVSGTLPLGNGGTGATGFTTTRVPFSNGTILLDDADFTFDASTTFLQVNSDATGSVKVGAYPGLPSYGGVWVGQSSPSGTNYSMIGNGSFTLFNSPTGGSCSFRVNNVETFNVGASTVSLAEGKNFTLGATTGSKWGTASTEKQGWWGTTPVVRSSGWSVTGFTTKKTLDPSTATLADVVNFVCTRATADLTYGLIGA